MPTALYERNINKQLGGTHLGSHKPQTPISEINPSTESKSDWFVWVSIYAPSHFLTL